MDDNHFFRMNKTYSHLYYVCHISSACTWMMMGICSGVPFMLSRAMKSMMVEIGAKTS